MTSAAANQILVVNAGSSSLKLRVLGPDDQVTARFDLDPWDGSADHGELAEFLGGLAGIAAAGHRVVHGGAAFTGPALIDDGVLGQIGALTGLAPLHQPRALAGIAAARAAFPGLPQVACFDTAFHAGLPAAAAAYPLPAAWRERFGLRRFGFHGLSHAYAARRAAQLLAKNDSQRQRVVTCHLGAGSSLAAVNDGHSVDTTMGFTPLEGLVMATRCGSIDPGMLIWLLGEERLTLRALADGLEHSSGLAGLAALPSGSGDMRQVAQAAAAGHAGAQLAVAVHAHRLAAAIAGMAAAMNGLDVLVFTGGIGEHHPAVRAEAAARLGFLGIAIDQAHNQAARADADISAPGAAVATVVVTAREDAEIARQVRALIADPA